MTEYNNETEDTTETVGAVIHDHNELVVAGLQKEIEMLTSQLETTKAAFTNWRDKFFTLDRKVKDAYEILSTAIEDEDLAEDNPFVKQIADHFEWSLTKEFKVTITATFTGTLTAPIGTKFDDFNDRGFDADLSLDNYTNENWEWEQNDYELEVEED